MAKIVFDDETSLEEYVEQYLKNTVQHHVRAILDHQLKDMVAGHLAAMRLDKPESSTVFDCVSDVVRDIVDARLRTILPGQLKLVLKETFA